MHNLHACDTSTQAQFTHNVHAGDISTKVPFDIPPSPFTLVSEPSLPYGSADPAILAAEPLPSPTRAQSLAVPPKTINTIGDPAIPEPPPSPPPPPLLRVEANELAFPSLGLPRRLKTASMLRGTDGQDQLVIDGEDFRRAVIRLDGSLDQAMFNLLWPRLRVLARCTPMDKYVIIQGCQAYRLPDGRRDIVAMTGA